MKIFLTSQGGNRGLGRMARVCAVGALLVTVDSQGAHAVTKTTKPKSTKKGTSTAKPATKPATKAAKTGAGSSALSIDDSLMPPSVTPSKRSSGTPIQGWSRISPTEWPTQGDAMIAVPKAKYVEAWRAPGDNSGSLVFQDQRSVYGTIRMLALDAQPGWVKVALPIRPNATVGWVRASEVTLQKSNVAIRIELASNTLRVYTGADVALETKVAAGTGGTPTPTGLFYVKELVPQANPAGALGPFAFGLSGFSQVLTSFANGEGTIGIHGTNAPNKLGGDVSHGCIRVRNDQILTMTKLVPVGTPVEIVQNWADLPTQRKSSDWVATASLPESTTTAAAATPPSAA